MLLCPTDFDVNENVPNVLASRSPEEPTLAMLELEVENSSVDSG